MLTAIFLVTNIHCPSCVSFVQDVLSGSKGLLAPIDVSLIRQTIRCSFDEAITDVAAITATLTQSAFEVQHVTVVDTNGLEVMDYDLSPPIQLEASSWSNLWRPKRQYHVDNCDACRKEKADVKLVDSRAKTWTNIIKTRRTNSAFSNDPIQASEDATAVDRPFVLSIDGTGSPPPPNDYVATVAIDGMTCSVCIGTITQAVEGLVDVCVISINLLTNSGVFRVRGKDNVNKLLQCIGDLGYGAELVSLTESSKQVESTKERVVELKIDGMHCANCPDRVMTTLGAAYSGDSAIKVLRPPSLRHPIIQIAYVPHVIEALNLRTIMSTIHAVDPLFKISVYHPPTLEERSRQLQHNERLSTLYRLCFTGIVALPTFIIGVVYMALVPKHNSTRMWFEQLMWSGNATRFEWALFLLTTPVMLFGADIFHRRALREIWVMWKPGSPFPYLRRFYRFGSMNLLISAATAVAYTSSCAILIVNAASAPSMEHSMSNTYFDAVTFLTFFILLGKYLEAYSKAKTGDAVTMLGTLRPKEALLVSGDRSSPQKISVDELEVGDHVMVLRGQSPSADGFVAQSGDFSFDESSLTGESKPVTKAYNDPVYAGTVNLGDSVEVAITEVGGTSMLDHIISVVRGGQAKRAPIERLADTLTGYFVPTITLLAITTWIIWMGLGVSGHLPQAWLDNKQGGWPFWSLEFAIAVFVIACPCGIGLAAPTALFVGGGVAATRGILVQGGGQAFQEASRVDAVVFDKTGTLTQGKMKVVDFEHHAGVVDEPTSLAIARAMESSSTHPIAQAIVTHIEMPATSIGLFDVSEIPGKGIRCRATVYAENGEEEFDAAIGNQDLIEDLTKHDDEAERQHAGTEVPDREHPVANSALYFMRQSIQRHQTQGHSIAILALRSPATAVSQRYTPVALFAIADPLRPEAPAVLATLRSLGIAVHMCTGDNPLTALSVASQLSIPATHIRSSALPQDKAAYIHALQNPSPPSHNNTPQNPDPRRGRHIIAFVGDGLNDAPALASADVSISLSSGSDIAITASSFILLNPHLSTVLELLALSRRVFLRVKLNFLWAALYNIILIPVAAGVFFMVGATSEHEGWRLGPVWAAVAMACSSFSVVLSSLALRLPEVSLGSVPKMLGLQSESESG